MALSYRHIIQAAFEQGLMPGLRLDANETANLDRAFRYTEAEVQKIEYGELTSAKDIPLDTRVPEWAQTVHYTVLDQVGKLEPIANFADDLPRSDVVLAEEEIPVKAWGGSYMYSIEDIQRAQAPGAFNLDLQRALANREVSEEHTDRTAYLGYAPFKIRGLLTDERVEILTPNIDGGDTLWAAKIANGDSGILSVAKDIADLIDSVFEDTNEMHSVTDCLLPTPLFNLLKNTRFQGNSDKTLLDWIKGVHPGVTFASRGRLNAANAGGTGGRIVAYKKAPTVLQHKLAMAYRTMPPQAKNLAFVVNGFMRTAGTHIYKHKCVKYMDGAN
jgi:hypothetical protein